MTQIEQLITSLRTATGNYTQLIRRKLGVLSDLVEEGEEHIHLGEHNVTKEHIGLGNLKNFKIANEPESQEALRNDLFVNQLGVKAFIDVRMGQVNSVTVPTIIVPANEDIIDDVDFILKATPYHNYFGFKRRVRQFQLTLSSDRSFSNPILDIEHDSDEYMVGASLNPGQALSWRCRDVSEDGVFGEWSAVASFALSQSYGGWTLQPNVLTVSGGSTTMDIQPTLTTNSYEGDSNNGELSKVEWEILTTDDLRVWRKETTNSSEFKSIQVDLRLDAQVDYVVRVRFHTDLHGWGEWRSISTRTFVEGNVLRPIVVVEDSAVDLQINKPNSLSVNPSVDDAYRNTTFISTGQVDDHRRTRWEVLDNNDQRLWYLETNDPNKLKVINSPDNLLELGKSYTLRVKYMSYTHGWSEWRSVNVDVAESEYIVTPTINVRNP